MDDPDPPNPASRPPLRTHARLFVAVAVVWLVLDQLTKSWAVARLPDGDIDVVWTLRFHLTYNSGASFSMGDGYGRWIALLAVVIVGLLVWQGLKVTSRLTAVALALIVGGAVGNVIDRAVRDGNGGFLGGAVVDFVDLRWWPVFNVADMGVVIGAILLVIASLMPLPDDGPPEGDDGPSDGPAPDEAPRGAAGA